MYHIVILQQALHDFSTIENRFLCNRLDTLKRLINILFVTYFKRKGGKKSLFKKTKELWIKLSWG